MIIIFKFLITGILSSLIFPPFFLLPIGFFSLTFLFFLLNEKKFLKKNKVFHFFAGVFFGLGMNLVIFNWIKEPFYIDPNTQNLSFISYFLIIYCSMYYGLITFIVSFFKNILSKLMIIPILFVLVEFLIGNVGYGFPWVSFGLSLSSIPFLLQIISFLGSYGFSYLILIIMFLPSLFYIIFNNKNFRINKIIYLTFILSFFLFSIFLVLTNNIKDLNTKSELYLVSLAQLNYSLVEKIQIENNFKKLKNIENIIKENKSDLLIFSENEYPNLVHNKNDFNKLSNLIKNDQTVIIGATRKENNNYYNSFVLIEKNNIKYFDKVKLVPFGEFLPFRNFLGFLDMIVGSSDYAKGNKKRLIKNFDNINFIPIICYEIIFAQKLIDKYENESNIIINLTNDSWFGSFSGPYQHFYLSLMKAVELNKMLIRVSSNGISGIVNKKGSILDYIPLNKKEIKNLYVSINTSSQNIDNYRWLILPFFLFIIFFSLVIHVKNDE